MKDITSAVITLKLPYIRMNSIFIITAIKLTVTTSNITAKHNIKLTLNVCILPAPTAIVDITVKSCMERSPS
jgi:hypothetical protein